MVQAKVLGVVGRWRVKMWNTLWREARPYKNLFVSVHGRPHSPKARYTAAEFRQHFGACSGFTS